MSDFDQTAYWIERHEKLKGEPRSVGNLAFSLEENMEGEKAIRDSMSDLARVLSSRYSSALDLGCGYGRIANCFTNAGFRYTGVDISELALDAARKECPDGRFVRANLLDFPQLDRFDVVCVLYVFVHFVDDENWKRFLFSALDRVRDGGLFLFADHFPAARNAPVAHVVGRPERDYRVLMEERGFSFSGPVVHALEETVHHPSLQRQFRFAVRESVGR